MSIMLFVSGNDCCFTVTQDINSLLRSFMSKIVASPGINPISAFFKSAYVERSAITNASGVG